MTALAGLCGHESPKVEYAEPTHYACTRVAGHPGTHRAVSLGPGGHNIEWPHDTLIELTPANIAIHTRHYRGRLEQFVQVVQSALELSDIDARTEIATWLMMNVETGK